MIRLFQTHKIRKQIELDGLWKFTPINSVAKGDILPIQYDYTMPVPGCWELHPEFLTYRGKAAYRREISLTKSTSLRLEFKGVSHTADVYFDGKHICHHYNAYTPFSTVLQDVEEGVHEVVVLVDNTFSEKSALHIGNDYYTYGGIIRPVLIEEIGDAFIDRIEFTPLYVEKQWKANIEVFLRNISTEPVEFTVKSDLEDYRLDFGDIKIAANDSASISKTFEFDDVEPWSHKKPKLYLLEVSICDIKNGAVVDDLIERVGFRAISIKDRKILVNGEEVLLMGYNRHEDHASVGCSIPFQLMVQDIEIIKNSGANAIRTSHYPNDELFLDLCDENGLYLWEENHARGLSLENMQNPNFEAQCEQCNEEMVQNHYNHPSIIVWGILNECASYTEEAREMYRKQFEQIRSMDQSRPLTYASCHHLKDLCFDLADIVSINLYAGWYENEKVGAFYQRIMDWTEEHGGKDKPVIISEFGAGGIYGFREPTRVKWSEERQCDILDDCLSVYLNRPEITGTFIWQYCDVRVTEENNWFFARPKSKNNKGIVDGYRRPKLAYEIVKKHFTSKNK